MERARDARLSIRRVMAEDEGVYTCRAENAVGAVEGSVSLIVHGELYFFWLIFFVITLKKCSDHIKCNCRTDTVSNSRGMLQKSNQILD